MNDGVPLLDLKAQYDTIRDEIAPVVERVIESQHFINGPEVVALEKEIAEYCGAPHAIGVSSGTDALLVALMALEIGPGDEVITTPYTFFATVGCIHRAGARPVLVDIDPASYNIDAAAVEGAITARTRAILPVHLYGRCADMGPILAAAGPRGIPVIEDAAQSIGAEHDGVRAGAIGDIGCFSFYPAKNLGAFGDGGLVTAREAAVADRIRLLREHGSRPKYYHSLVGGNFRLDAIQAAVLRVKLRHLEKWNAARLANAEDYRRRFEATGLVGDRITLPRFPGPSHRHVFNQFVLRSARRDDLAAHLRERRIGCEIYYPVPLHLQECFRSLGHAAGDFPESERAAAETLAIPVYPELTEAQRERVVAAIAEFHGKRA